MTIETTRRVCLAEPPPAPTTMADADMLSGGDVGCPAAFAGCLTSRGAVALRRHLADLHRYAHDAWDLCGTETKENQDEVPEVNR